jgi:hypothetical protein
MKILRIPLVAALSVALISVFSLARFSAVTGVVTVGAQGQSTALERGYRTGYSDGFNAGYKDVSDRATRDFQNKPEYQEANRSYNQVWGPLEDYRDGYQQGYEAGYANGYDGQSFNSSIPTGLARRGASQQREVQAVEPQTNPAAQPQTTPDDDAIVNRSGNNYPSNGTATSGPMLIPHDTFLIVEIESSLSTDASQRGDRFQARVIEPAQYQGAIIEGRVTRVKRPGRVKGVAELQLSFEQIRMPDNRSGNFGAEVVEVVPTGRDDQAEVDREGGVRGRDSTKDDVAKVGATTGIGALIGLIAGGAKGAAIGAAIGGSVGAGGVLSTRGKDIRLDRGQQLKLRTSTDARIQ